MHVSSTWASGGSSKPALLHKSFIEIFLRDFENGIAKFVFNSSFKVSYICYILNTGAMLLSEMTDKFVITFQIQYNNWLHERSNSLD